MYGFLKRANLVVCCLLALIATAAWWVMLTLADGLADSWPASMSDIPAWLLCWASGSVYAWLVLSRYSGGKVTSAALFLLAGAVSYWAGVQFSVLFDLGVGYPLQVGLAGLMSAVFLAAVCVQYGTLTHSARLYGWLAVAGALGGASIGAAVELGGDLSFTAGHGVWQVLTCAALHRNATIEA